MFQIPTDLAVKEPSFLEIQELRDLLYTVFIWRGHKFCILKHFLKHPIL